MGFLINKRRKRMETRNKRKFRRMSNKAEGFGQIIYLEIYLHLFYYFIIFLFLCFSLEFYNLSQISEIKS